MRDLSSAIIDDMDVHGYPHWSLTGGYEWFNGCQEHLGLAGAGRGTWRRAIRRSAAVPGGIAPADTIA